MISWLRTPRLPAAFEYMLDDRTPVLVRPLEPGDARRVRDAFRELSPQTRRRRMMEVSELSAEQLRALTTLDHVGNAAFIATCLERPHEPGVGVVRYSRQPGDPESADVNVTIVDAYQGRGAGFVLQACLHLLAHRNGIRRFYYDVLAEDERIMRHLELMGARRTARVEGIQRMCMPVYRRALDVPRGNDIGRRFAEVFRRLHKVRPRVA